MYVYVCIYLFMIIFPLKQLIKCFLSSRLSFDDRDVYMSLAREAKERKRECVNRFSIDNLICSFSLFSLDRTDRFFIG